MCIFFLHNVSFDKIVTLNLSSDGGINVFYNRYFRENIAQWQSKIKRWPLITKTHPKWTRYLSRVMQKHFFYLCQCHTTRRIDKRGFTKPCFIMKLSDTDYRFVICSLHRLYCKVSVIPKAVAGPRVPILLLVQPWQRSRHVFAAQAWPVFSDLFFDSLSRFSFFFLLFLHLVLYFLCFLFSLRSEKAALIFVGLIMEPDIMTLNMILTNSLWMLLL